ncbi:hypothetical protein D9756_004568 [Leucocoprinus leucothites]|uniref:Uncharacterized protein n=1 Tax=Leucocoprinus leucothites TaxID=201217 RepID=A0A8H5G901_9AGAR|nr:hypothetical protein D9756_004568 [Leucoagaricus leucothites]
MLSSLPTDVLVCEACWIFSLSLHHLGVPLFDSHTRELSLIIPPLALYAVFDVPSRVNEPFDSRLEFRQSFFSLGGSHCPEYVNMVAQEKAWDKQHALEALKDIEGFYFGIFEVLIMACFRRLHKGTQSSTSLKVRDMEAEAGSTTAKIQELRQKATERYLAKRQMLASRKEKCNRNVRGLSVLPEEAFEKYINERLDKAGAPLVKMLHTVNEGPKKLARVKQETFEQAGKSAVSIEDPVQAPDQRKDEAIEKTFKHVAKNFEEVFEKLMDDKENEETQQSTIENYTSVSIKVLFNSKVDEGLRIQLSGG